MFWNIIAIFTAEKIRKMKKTFLHYYVIATVLFSDYMLFAQPNDETDPGDDPLEGDDTPAAPINGKLLFLALAGILFAYYAFRRNRQSA